MPIKISHGDTITLADISETAVAQSSREEPDGQGGAVIVTTYYGQAMVATSEEPVQIVTEIPKKIFRHLCDYNAKKLAPYIVAEAMRLYPGVRKHAGVGSPDPKDQD